ncbi:MULTISPECIES: Gfo/Idh/MocA family protein [Microbacterium]|uniref:Gfo/Idh/MocA family oxidoreductase n=1 Tax=Microbacterium wangchenii TaxID=2541726 RepID=A0ABX5SPL0_9MICO|nr:MULTISPECIES: Gfo/Idh/MocA family oxidoreductase [Microbacterium]MCK6066762.1 Gfo/Idh/MocA family oxidoreductase [Microbacterium sp. EYE_512]QBR88080.1 Gfo/Idh/MocA family oxidoreductase [Microbacterium wangchenii]TXK18130.1 Gfo/Idh/MocA family oxidoreductase [Microbacterium wangchenii]
MAALRAGLLGVGMMGRHHARVLREVDGIELVAIADPGGDPHGVAGGLGILPDIDALMDAGIDIAVVAVPTRFHEEAALKLAAAGVHTLVEKPIAHTLDAGQRMVDAFENAGLVGAVGHIERFNPALQELRRRLEAGDLGSVYQIQTRRQGPFPSRIADVGVAKDLASHDVDLTAWVAQSVYTSVYAQTAVKSGREHEDMIAITGRLASGVIVNHLVNWLSPMKERVTVVTGEKGAFVADTSAGDLTFFANGTIPLEWESVSSFRGVSEGDVTRFAIAKREPLRVELESFRDAVLGGESDVVTMAQGQRTLVVVEAAVDSARTGESIAV